MVDKLKVQKGVPPRPQSAPSNNPGIQNLAEGESIQLSYPTVLGMLHQKYHHRPLLMSSAIFSANMSDKLKLVTDYDGCYENPI